MTFSTITGRGMPALVVLTLFVACEGAPEPGADAPGTEPAATAEDAAPAEAGGETTTATTEGAGLNLNTATREEFLTVPGVGDRMVAEFFEYRPYVSIRQFRREIGKYVDEERVAAYERYVYVPVDPNESDAATLEQMPGVDAAVSAELVAGRPYATNQAFVDALAAQLTDEQFAEAEAYIAAP